jgi:hypothetical protein
MESLLNNIKTTLKYCPQPNIRQYTVSSDLLQYLQTHFSDTRFNLKEIPVYLNSVDKHIVITIDNLITLNVIMNSEQYIPELLLKRLVKRLYTLIKYYAMNQKLVIWLLPLEVNRVFPAHNKDVTPLSINGGFTFPAGNEIFIYRLEDFPKVCLHELLHHSPIDNHLNWTDEQMNTLKELFNISNDTLLLPNEAIVETWATIYQLAFISIEYDIPFKDLYNFELLWAMQQSKRLLIHQNGEEWSETSNSYSYIIIKGIFLYNMNEFILVNMNATDKLLEFIKQRTRKYLENIKNIKIKKTVKKASMRISILGDL